MAQTKTIMFTEQNEPRKQEKRCLVRLLHSAWPSKHFASTNAETSGRLDNHVM